MLCELWILSVKKKKKLRRAVYLEV